MLTTNRARALAAEYIGCQPDEFTTVAVVPDPEVPGVWGVRVVLDEDEVMDFLLLDEGLKDVVFDEWPPARPVREAS